MGVLAGYLEKRSMRIDGHRTSVALEPEFWRALEGLARSVGVSMPKLAADTDGMRQDGQTLVSALPCRALAFAAGRLK